MILNEINFILNYIPIKGHKLYSPECSKPLLFLTFYFSPSKCLFLGVSDFFVIIQIVIKKEKKKV